MLVFHANTPGDLRAEILEYLRYTAVQVGPHPILHTTKRAIREAELRAATLHAAIKHLETAKIEPRETKSTTLTPDENRAWEFAFAHYVESGMDGIAADAAAWRDIQLQFPRLAAFDGCNP